MLKTLSKLNTSVYYWNSVENTTNNYGKRFPPLLRVFPATPTVVNNSVGNGFYDAFLGNSSTQNELKSKKKSNPRIASWGKDTFIDNHYISIFLFQFDQ